MLSIESIICFILLFVWAEHHLFILSTEDNCVIVALYLWYPISMISFLGGLFVNIPLTEIKLLLLNVRIWLIFEFWMFNSTKLFAFKKETICFCDTPKAPLARSEIIWKILTGDKF